MKSFVLTREPVLFTLAGCARSQENRLFDTLICREDFDYLYLY